jgi:signal peptidase I
VTDVVTEETAVPAAEDATEPDPPRSRRSRLSRGIWYATVAVLAAFLATCAVWTLTGGRTYVVTTPSMSPGVPVGSLVLIRPDPPGGPHVGQIIAFHPPNEPKTTYTHRVIKIGPDGTYSTKGDLDSTPDAWVLTRKQIIGVATHHFKRVGWIVRALPWLALGAVVLMALLTVVPRAKRRITTFVGGTVVLSVPILVLHPLVRGVFAGSGLIQGKIHALVVNTGLLPLRFTMKGAAAQHTASGYPANLIAKPPKHGFLTINGVVDLSVWGWIILVLICLAPLMIALVVPPHWWDGSDANADTEEADTEETVDDSADESAESADELNPEAADEPTDDEVDDEVDEPAAVVVPAPRAGKTRKAKDRLPPEESLR